MKSVAYILAGLAAIGIMITVATMPSGERSGDAPASLVSVDDATASEVMDTPGSLTLAVPGMHCQFACFPRVKEALEGTEGVSEVVLAEQPDPDSLSNKQVIVKYEAGFDVSKAINGLNGIGFTDSAKVQ